MNVIESPLSSQRRAYASAALSNRNGQIRHEWERANFGGVTTIIFQPPDIEHEVPVADEGGEEAPMLPTRLDDEAHKLDQFRATAIAGNDITSSCLYAAGITLSEAGIAAPISASLIIVVLYIFRGIYAEVGSGLPMNGGTYNALLNTFAKWVAALAAVLSLVSYTATAVTSAASAGEYLHYQWDVVPALWLTIAILVFFALLNLIGISESATSAAVLFAFHLLTMGVLIVTCLIFVIRDHASVLQASFGDTGPEADPKGSWAANIWNGYCAALLGVTGFETSSNYIEEQRAGVFPKTLRNMWIAVSLLNPTLVLLAMGVLPIDNIVSQSNYSLAAMAYHAGGDWLKMWVVIDASLVLSGAVLTSYVGIGGLMRRMASDQLLPSFFTATNSCRRTHHWVIIIFCILTCSLRLLVNDMNTLGGVYAIAFLGVMSLFAVANLAVKFKRGGLKRTPIVPVHVVFLGLACVLSGMIGNMVRSVRNAEFFILYFAAFSVVVVGSIWRIPILRATAAVVEWPSPRAAAVIRGLVGEIRSAKVMFFTKTCDASRLNKVIQYVLENEDTSNVVIVYCDTSDDEAGSQFVHQLEESCTILDFLYPKLTVEMIVVKAPFCPETLEKLSQEFHVPKNFMFITCPSDRFPHDMRRFGGLRVISY